MKITIEGEYRSNKNYDDEYTERHEGKIQVTDAKTTYTNWATYHDEVIVRITDGSGEFFVPREELIKLLQALT